MDIRILILLLIFAFGQFGCSLSSDSQTNSVSSDTTAIIHKSVKLADTIEIRDSAKSDSFKFLANSHSSFLDVNAWNTFNGKLGNDEVQLSLYLFADGSIKGNYVFKKHNAKIQLIGHPKANALFLTEVTNNNSKIVFRGNLFTDTLDKFEGTWVDSSQKKTANFYFTLSSINWGYYEYRYSDMFGTTLEIEAFMDKVKSAILSDNKEWLAAHIHYPTRQVLEKGFTSINNKQELILYFNEVFTPNFKNKIRHQYTTNLFTKNGAAMLGDGEIWIGNTSGSTADKYDFIITAINPLKPSDHIEVDKVTGTNSKQA